MNHQWFDNSRISAISDGVFAMAMTLLVLDLKLPDLDYSSVAAIFLLVISFAILCRLWIAQHAILDLHEKKTQFSRITSIFITGLLGCWMRAIIIRS